MKIQITCLCVIVCVWNRSSIKQKLFHVMYFGIFSTLVLNMLVIKHKSTCYPTRDHRPQFENSSCEGEQEAGFWRGLGLVGLFKVFQCHPQDSGNLLSLSREVCDVNRFVFSKDTPRLLFQQINSSGARMEVDGIVAKHGHLAGRRWHWLWWRQGHGWEKSHSDKKHWLSPNADWLLLLLKQELLKLPLLLLCFVQLDFLFLGYLDHYLNVMCCS